MSVLRSKTTNEITHISIHFANGMQYYLTKKDYDLYMSHEVTEDETRLFFGEDNLTFKEISNVANGDYPQQILKYDIMRYNELFQDPIKAI
jgi:hypothetical protein